MGLGLVFPGLVWHSRLSVSLRLRVGLEVLKRGSEVENHVLVSFFFFGGVGLPFLF